MPAKLTVLIPCRNESKNIRACIESARSVADEILVADSLSTDDTVKIVRQMRDCRIIQREFVNYADFKNWAMPQAKYAWVLIVDADERITEELAREIKRVLDDPPDHRDAYFVPRRVFFMGHEIRYSGWQTDRLLRLVRRDRSRYQACRVHEEIQYNPRRVGNLKGKLLHYSYWSYDQFFEKQLSQTRLSAEDAWDQGKRSSYWTLLARPTLRFLHLYIVRRGFLDGLPGLQLCMLMAFFNTFIKQARLWEMERAMRQSECGEDPRSAAIKRLVEGNRPAVLPSPGYSRQWI